MRRLLVAIMLVLLCLTSTRLHAQDSNLAKTPPMGWNSWNLLGCKVSDQGVRAAADAMASSGMKDAGYTYLNIDDCWEGQRDAQGNIQSNERFPDMKALADYVHSKGLKIGLYSSPGPKTCGGFEGSYGHEVQDARTYAAWGFDYLKYDWCSGDAVYKRTEIRDAYKKMGDALKGSGRPIVFSLCEYGLDEVWKWAPSIGGNLWRNTGDLWRMPGDATYNDILAISYNAVLASAFAQQDGLGRFAGPGRWNDPDVLLVGNHDLTLDENKLHFSMWAMLAAPLLTGNDLAHMKPEILGVLTNREVVAIDQDPLGVEAHRVWEDGPVDVWMRPLADGSKAVAFFNKGESPGNITVLFRELGLPAKAEARDLWAHKDLGSFTDSFSTQVPQHAVVLLRMR